MPTYDLKIEVVITTKNYDQAVRQLIKLMNTIIFQEDYQNIEDYAVKANY